MSIVGSFHEQPFIKTRNASVDVVELGRRMHHIPVLFEVDVTRARELIAAFAEKTGEKMSFTAWVVKCVAQAAGEHKRVHAMRRGRSRVVLFDDVDVSITVERQAPGATETIPMPLVLRRANEKGVLELHREVRDAQRQPLEPGESQLGVSGRGRWIGAFFSLPGPLRRLVMRAKLVNDPFFAKRTMGTVMVTAIGMFGGGRGNVWGIPVGIHPLSVAVGNIVKKPAIVDGAIVPREMLSMTVLFDHDVVDGAPVARFIARFQELLERGSGLDALA